MDIKKILKHIDGVEGKKKRHMQLNEAASMIINGDNADDVGIILDRIKGVTTPSAPAPQGNSMRGDMDKFLSVMGPREPVDMNMGMGDNLPALANSPNEKYADVSAVTTKAGGGLNGPKNPKDIRVKDPSPYQDIEDESAVGGVAGAALGGAMGGIPGAIAGGAIGDKLTGSSEETEEWANEPEETETDHDTMLNDLSGGINRQKKMFSKAQDGDNAMAVEGAVPETEGEFRDEDNGLNIRWSYDKYDDSFDIEAYDDNENMVRMSPRQKREYQDRINSEGNDAADDYGDYKMHQKQDNDMAFESIKARLLKALHEANAKPDFLDMDKDGNKKEPMKGAAKDAKKGKMPPQFKKK